MSFKTAFTNYLSVNDNCIVISSLPLEGSTVCYGPFSFNSDSLIKQRGNFFNVALSKSIFLGTNFLKKRWDIIQQKNGTLSALRLQ